MIKKFKLTRKRKEQFVALSLLLPALIMISVFTIFPIFNNIFLSFHEMKLATPKPHFIGIENYVNLLDDPIFIKVMRNSVFFAIVTVPISMIIGLLFAVFLNRNMKGRGFLRTSFFYPSLFPMVAVANIWLFIYTPTYGLLARLINFVAGFNNTNYLGDGHYVMWALIVMFIWREAGYLMIFYLAGLQNVDKSLYEASVIDGATSWKKFRYITLPLIMPTTLFVSIIAVTNSFKLIDHLVIMTGGGPNNASNVLLYHIYENAFRFWNQGKAATLTSVLLIIMLIIAIIQIVFVDKKIHYE